MGCGGGWRKSPDVPQAVTSELPPDLPRNSLRRPRTQQPQYGRRGEIGK
jgi:hypothetical protein